MSSVTERKKTGSITIIALIVVSLLVLFVLQKLLMPKYMHGITEGSMISEYYAEKKDHDVIFVGDCEIYENISPAVLWQEYGINSYIRGSAQQLIWQSYYLMEETFKYEKPKAIVFNVLSMQYDKPQNEAYNRMTLDGMQWSKSKTDSIKASMTSDEHMIEYVFPILRYHSRITELEKDDITYLFHKDTTTFNGYYMRVDVKTAENVPTGRPLGNYQFGDICYEYLDKMRILCEENGTELIFIKAPSLYPYWYDEWDEQIEEYSSKYGIAYYNFLDDIDEIGLDFSEDTYDAGLHLNLSGAEKLSTYFGNILVTKHDIPSRKDDKTLANRWDQKIQLYNEEINRQYAELENN